MELRSDFPQWTILLAHEKHFNYEDIDWFEVWAHVHVYKESGRSMAGAKSRLSTQSHPETGLNPVPVPESCFSTMDLQIREPTCRLGL